MPGYITDRQSAAAAEQWADERNRAIAAIRKVNHYTEFLAGDRTATEKAELAEARAFLDTIDIDLKEALQKEVQREDYPWMES